ncbi:MAG: DUF58 domain-containing protein [Pseudomonadota bacterium]
MNLTPLSYLFVALIALLGVVGEWSPDYAGWWRLPAILWVAAAFYDWYSTRNLNLQATLAQEPTIHLGRSEQLTLTLANRTQRTLSIEYAPGLPAPLKADDASVFMTLPAENAQTIRIPTMADALGSPVWRKLPMRIKGPLGLARVPFNPLAEVQFIIVPDLIDNPMTLTGNHPSGRVNLNAGGGQELHHIRDYAPGDPRHTIDWKATARTNSLVTKVFSTQQSLEIMLVLDIGRTSRTSIHGLPVCSHYINLCSRFTQQAVSKGDRVGLIAASHNLPVVVPPQAGTTAVQQIRDGLTGLTPQQTETDMLRAALQLQHLVKHRCLIILLTDFYSQQLEGSFGQSLRLWNRRHLTMVVGLMDQTLFDLTQQSAQTAQDPYLTLASQEYINSVNNNARAASRLGAHPIVTNPDHLENSVVRTYARLKQQGRV